jgi:hypothetical protein
VRSTEAITTGFLPIKAIFLRMTPILPLISLILMVLAQKAHAFSFGKSKIGTLSSLTIARKTCNFKLQTFEKMRMTMKGV